MGPSVRPSACQTQSSFLNSPHCKLCQSFTKWSVRIKHGPLFGYLRSDVFIFGRELPLNRRISRIDDDEETRELLRKRFNKQNKNPEFATRFLVYLFAVTARQTLSNLIRTAMPSLAQFYLRYHRFINTTTTVATSISSKRPGRRESQVLNPKTWKKNKKKSSSLPWVSFLFSCMVMNFLSRVVIFEINVSNPPREKRKNKRKTLYCDNISTKFKK